MTKEVGIIHKCGICDSPVEDDENWTETDALICEACSDRANDDADYANNNDRSHLEGFL